MNELPPNYNDQIEDLADTLSELNLTYLTHINNTLRYCPNEKALDKVKQALRVMHKQIELRLLRINDDDESDDESDDEDETPPPLNPYALDIFKDWACNKGVPLSYADYFIPRLNRLDYTPRIMKGQFTRIYTAARREGRTFPHQN